MSLITTFRAPGTGRRQAEPNPRLVAENQRLLQELRHEREARKAAQAEHRHTASVLGEYVVLLGEEQTAHWRTRGALDRAVRANEANANAETVQTDVTALRAAMADVVPAEPEPVPQYRPYRRVVAPAVRVMPLWQTPFATTNPARVPPLFTPADAA